MIIEQPPLLYRALFPGARWRIKNEGEKTIYLTFDDGPIPEVTPWVLDILNQFEIKATFFCVGDNVRKYPEIFKLVTDNGHQIGNHTFNHLQGWQHNNEHFINNANLAKEYINSKLFRPPHGHMRYRQCRDLQKEGYHIIMWDVVTRDYSKWMKPEQVYNNVKRYTRDGSIIVFHDSLKAENNLRYALPKSIEWLLSEGYSFKTIGIDNAIAKSTANEKRSSVAIF
ncbi:MAG: polysaccharide deacetylase family protein [Proteiniphilum sp.]|nr:polysaccharide deacetylase family protein [Proteiniphilum sp.]